MPKLKKGEAFLVEEAINKKLKVKIELFPIHIISKEAAINLKASFVYDNINL